MSSFSVLWALCQWRMVQDAVMTLRRCVIKILTVQNVSASMGAVTSWRLVYSKFLNNV